MKKRRDPNLTSAEKFGRLRQCMFRLVGNDSFQDFIEEMREMQHSTMIDLCSDAVVKDERMTLAAAGELRAYSQIIGYGWKYSLSGISHRVGRVRMTAFASIRYCFMHTPNIQFVMLPLRGNLYMRYFSGDSSSLMRGGR